MRIRRAEMAERQQERESGEEALNEEEREKDGDNVREGKEETHMTSPDRMMVRQDNVKQQQELRASQSPFLQLPYTTVFLVCTLCGG